MKVALVHDYLIECGGGERVLAALSAMFPEAPIYTSVFTPAIRDKIPEIKGKRIIPSWFDKVPFSAKLLSPLRFLTPLIWESFDFSNFDLVVISSGAMIPRGILTKPETKVIAYVHTPPRNLYGYEAGSLWERHKIVRIYGRFINHFLRIYDFYAAQKPDLLIANSKNTATRIRKFWRRNSQIIYPPVKLADKKIKVIVPPAEILPKKFHQGGFYLSVGRLQYLKRVDLIVKVFNVLKKPLVVVGDGVEMKRGLRELNTSRNTYFAGFVEDKYLPWFYKNAKAFIFAAKDEDFGIVPVEAQSYGLPVIAHISGGTKETVVDGQTGVFFKKHTVSSLIAAVKKLDNYLKFGKIRPENCRRRAQKFSQEVFIKNFKKTVKDVF